MRLPAPLPCRGGVCSPVGAGDVAPTRVSSSLASPAEISSCTSLRQYPFLATQSFASRFQSPSVYAGCPRLGLAWGHARAAPGAAAARRMSTRVMEALVCAARAPRASANLA